MASAITMCLKHSMMNSIKFMKPILLQDNKINSIRTLSSEILAKKKTTQKYLHLNKKYYPSRAVNH